MRNSVAEPTSDPRPVRFQFRLATLLIATTILCLYFAVAGGNPALAIWIAAITTNIATIYFARRTFGHSPALAGALGMVATPFCMGFLWFIVAIIDYLAPTPSGTVPSYSGVDVVCLITAVGAAIGLFLSFYVAVGYWVLAGLRSRIFDWWDFIDKHTPRDP